MAPYVRDLDPNFDYESILGEYFPKKNKALKEVAYILSKPIFKVGKKRYAVRVYRHTGKADLNTYQIDVWADNLSSLRLKLLKNIPWDLQRKNSLTTSVKIYRTYAIDKSNIAGYLEPSYSKKYFVWNPDDDNPSVKVNVKNGNLTRQIYDADKDYYTVHPKESPNKKRRM